MDGISQGPSGWSEVSGSVGGSLALATTTLAICLISACGIAASPAVVSPDAAVSPTPNQLTSQFVKLVHNYWVDLIVADGNAPMVCLNGPIQPANCQARAAAQLVVQKKFIHDLDTTPVPPQFAAPDKVLIAEVPKAIVDLEAMITAAQTGNKDAVVEATAVYVSEMQPNITNALDAIDTGMVHQR
jgi:hypothetical protein